MVWGRAQPLGQPARCDPGTATPRLGDLNKPADLSVPQFADLPVLMAQPLAHHEQAAELGFESRVV